MKLNNINIYRLKIISVCMGLFIITLVFLLGSSGALNLVESKLTFASNLSEGATYPAPTNVEGVSNKNTIEIKNGQIDSPNFSALGVIAEDVNLNKVLFSKNSRGRLSPASTTKIMTALVGIEYFKPADVLVVPGGAMIGGSNMGLVAGESMTFRSLLYGMLLNSGNDAAYTIALNFPGGFDGFVAKMNEKVAELNLVDTNFQNPAGFDSPSHYSSAHDLAVIAKEVIKDSTLARIISTKETSVMSMDKTRIHTLKNLNKLLSQPGVIGVKTGFTEKSGENLVGLVERDGHRILTVVLSSTDRFGETKSLMDWIFKNFTWVQ